MFLDFFQKSNLYVNDKESLTSHLSTALKVHKFALILRYKLFKIKLKLYFSRISNYVFKQWYPQTLTLKLWKRYKRDRQHENFESLCDLENSLYKKDLKLWFLFAGVTTFDFI